MKRKGSRRFFQDGWAGSPIGVAAAFLSFTLTGALLSYTDPPAAWKVILGCLGVLGPLVLIVMEGKSSSLNPFPREDGPWRPSTLVAAGVVLAAAVLRFFICPSWMGFPLYDEAVNGFYALDLSRHWNWDLFQSATQLPPFFNWALALFEKAFGPSLEALRLVPAFFSFLAALLAWAAARLFFSRTLSFWFFLFLALGFWPVLAGGFAHQGGLMLLWEWAGFCLWGWFDRAPARPSRLWRAALLGLWVGSGFYTYFSWVLVAAFLALAFGWSAARKAGKEKAQIGFVFTLAGMAAVLPLAVSAVRSGFGGYLWNLSVLNPSSPGPAAGGPATALYNLSMIFWRGWKGYFSYGPAWGGLLNPVMGGFFFVGLSEILRHRRHKAALWIGLALGLGLGPILFSRMLNSFHLVQLIPLFFLIAALGFQKLLSLLPWRRALWGAAGLVLLSLFLDGVNLQRTIGDMNRNHPAQKPPLDVKAWETLRDFYKKRGPGLFFSSFNAGQVRPPFLKVACASFNALDNPRLPDSQCAWVAWMGNVNYQPFLKKLFPGGRYFWLSKEDPPADGGTLLWVAPLTGALAPFFRKWREADQALGPFEETNLLKRNPGDPRALLESLRPAYPSFQGDPLLESFYWEKAADIQTQALWLSSYGKATGENLAELPSGPLALQGLTPAQWDGPIQDLQSALRWGCPAAHLYYRLGLLYSLAGKEGPARKAFQGALKAPLDFTQSRALYGRLAPSGPGKGRTP